MDNDKILQSVPSMRRYAGLMCLNDRARGDAFVEAALKTVVARMKAQAIQDDHRLKLLSALHREFRHRASELPQTPPAAHLSPSLSRQAASADQAAPDILQLLATMTVEQRGALLLVVAEGLSYDDIAEVIGVSVATARSLLADARRQLDRDECYPAKTA